MKKLLLFTILFTTVNFFSKAQSSIFKPFQIGIGSGFSNGLALYIHPQYNLNDKLTIGLNLQSAIVATGINGSSGSASAVGTYQLTGVYHFSTEKVRPYVGLGLGLSNVGTVAVSNSSAAADYGTKFGVTPKVGVKMGHFKLEAEYNILPSSTINTFVLQPSHFLLKLGFDIEGGRK